MSRIISSTNSLIQRVRSDVGRRCDVASCLTLPSLVHPNNGCRVIPSRSVYRAPSLEDQPKNPKRRGCTKWRQGGLIKTDIHSGMKGQAPVPKPPHDFKTGDRNLYFDLVPPSLPQVKFRDVDDTDLHPLVKKIISTEYSDRAEFHEQHYHALLDKVRRHPADEDSLEVVIVKETIKLKTLLRVLELKRKHRRPLHDHTQRMVDARYAKLLRLRNHDYDRFVWLCDLLQIDFQLKPDVEVDLNERNKILQRAKGEADKLKEEKINEYKQFLVEERNTFEFSKKQTIEKLEKDLAQFGFDQDKEYSLTEDEKETEGPWDRGLWDRGFQPQH